MFDLLVWRNKRRTLFILLVAVLIFMALYMLLYPKTVFTLIVDHENGYRMIYRMNTRGTVHMLDYAGRSDRDGTVRLPPDAARQAEALARAALEPGSGALLGAISVHALTVGQMTVSGPDYPPAMGELWALLQAYMP